MLALINIILTCGDLSAQPIKWCKTIDAGPNFKEIYEWEEGDYLGSARYDVRSLGLSFIRLQVTTLWMITDLNDNGLRGDPTEADSIFSHWQKVPFGDHIIVSDVIFAVMDNDSTWLIEIHPGTFFPNIKDIPEEMSPNEGMVVDGDTIEFNWNEVENVDYYAVYIWNRQPDIENFSSGLCYYNEFLTEVNLILPSAYLNQAGTYYWILISYGECIWEGGGMEIAQFEYRPDNVVIPPPIETNRYATIYPNPVRSGNEIFIANLNAPVQSLSIIDITGRVILNKPLLEENSSFAGCYSLTSNPLPPGLYFLRFESDLKSRADGTKFVFKFLVH